MASSSNFSTGKLPTKPPEEWAAKERHQLTLDGFMKKRPSIISIDRPASEAVKVELDSDFSDGDGPVQSMAKKKQKALPKAKEPNPSIPASAKPASRIQACGANKLDRAIQAVRDNDHLCSTLTVVSLNYHLDIDKKDVGEIIKATDNAGAEYELPPPCEPKLTTLGFAEFLGLFYSGVDDDGVGDLIKNIILQNSNAHVIVVDGTPTGANFARLAACIGAVKIKQQNSELGTKLYKQITKPQDPVFKAAVAKAYGIKSDINLRCAMREFYYEHMSK
jgi:hypothetical protein